MRIVIFGKTIYESDSVKQKRYGKEAFVGNGSGSYSNFYSHSFTGEKNSGDMGPAKEYYCDHDTLRVYSWQLFLESDICQTVFKAYNRWTIGSGLKLQAKPASDVLKSEKIILNSEEFNNISESRFEVYSESKLSDYSGMDNLHKIASQAFINSIVGGDVLVVLRMEKGNVTVQLIDGANLGTPINISFNPLGEYVTESGNRVKHGVEIDSRRQHVAYHVKTGFMKFERIPARGAKSGALMAFLVYGLKYRLDNVRGIPLISAVMETAKKMDRYKEATLGSAEENAKIPFTIEHTEISSGENPFLSQFAQANGFEDIPVTIDGEILANKVAATTNKQVVNMPQGASLKSVESKKELYFEPFFSVNIMLVCATVGIPKDVAMMAYESNYSASRAAIMDWGHSLNVGRKYFSDQFYKNIYNLWLDIQILSNKIQAPGYLKALFDKDVMIVESYRSCSWLGANVPHIDPLKEVMAERAKLGDGSAHIPLTTVENATKAVNGGDAWGNMEQYAEELKEADLLNIVKTEKISPLGNEVASNTDIKQ